MPAERIPLGDLLDPGHHRTLEKLTERISRGAVFIYPTETIYGIGGRCDNAEVYRRIIAVKERPPDQPMILVAAHRSSLTFLDISLPPAARQLAAAWWPGPLTIVLPSASRPEGIAVRVSDHPFLCVLAHSFTVPLFSTSANVSGTPYRPDPDTIFAEMKDQVDFMVDAGVLPVSEPSTVVRVGEDNTVTVLREGVVSTAAIRSTVTG